jgi:hypothetical protein
VYVSYEVVVKGSIDLNSRQQSRHTQNTLEKKKNAPNEDTKHTIGWGRFIPQGSGLLFCLGPFIAKALGGHISDIIMARLWHSAEKNGWCP